MIGISVCHTHISYLWKNASGKYTRLHDIIIKIFPLQKSRKRRTLIAAFNKDRKNDASVRKN